MPARLYPKLQRAGAALATQKVELGRDTTAKAAIGHEPRPYPRRRKETLHERQVPSIARLAELHRCIEAIFGVGDVFCERVEEVHRVDVGSVDRFDGAREDID